MLYINVNDSFLNILVVSFGLYAIRKLQCKLIEKIQSKSYITFNKLVSRSRDKPCK